MIRLLLETATDVCSVAVAKGDIILAEHTATEAHQHSSHLTLFIQQVMEEAQVKMTDLDEVVLSDGPGSYTSLRVGAATAKGLCLALPGLKLRVVPTLIAIAVASGAGGLSLATIKSRKGEVFGQLVSEFESVTEIFNVKIKGPDPFFEPLCREGQCSVVICGPGQDRLSEAEWLKDPLWVDAMKNGNNGGYSGPKSCSAAHLLAPALSAGYYSSRLVDVAIYEPFYLNPPFVTKSKKKLLG